MTKKFKPKYNLGRRYFVKSLKHGIELWIDQSSPTKDWGKGVGSGDNDRTFTKFVADRIEGKLGEAAFSRMLREEFNLETEIDWDIYGSIDKTDESDLKALISSEGKKFDPCVSFDVKKTKPRNLWLAIRHSIWQDHKDSDPIILTKLELPERVNLEEWSDSNEYPGDDPEFNNRIDEWCDANLPVSAQVVGFAEKQEFTDYFERGDRLYHPDGEYEIGPPLKTKNNGIPIKQLNSSRGDWNNLVSRIIGDHPIQWSSI